MCSINHDLKALYIHIPKTGGTFVSNVLSKYYGFKNYYLKRPDHNIFCKLYDNSVDKHENKFYGTYLYYKTSPYLNKIMNMDEKKWLSYRIFTFIRDPIKRLISGYYYSKENNHYKNINFYNFYKNSIKLNCWVYWHCFMPQIRHIVNENNENICFFIGKQDNLENDLNYLLNLLNIKPIHTNFKKNQTKIKENLNYNVNEIKNLFYEDYNRLY